MKKMRLLTMLLIAAAPVMAIVDVVPNSDFDEGGTGWGFNGSATVWSVPNGQAGTSNFYTESPAQGGATVMVVGWSNMDQAWAGTSERIKNGATYALTARVCTALGNAPDWGDGLFLSIQDADNGYAPIVDWTSFLFPDGDNSDPVAGRGPWREYSISFNSADHPETIGHKMLVAIALDDNNGRTGWGTYGWLYVDWVRMLVEAAEEPIPADAPELDEPVARAATTELSWVNPENINKCDVWFGDITGSDANELNYRDGRLGATPYVILAPTPPASGREVVSILADLGATPLVKDHEYAWAVDCYRGTPTEPNLPGTVWKFTVTDAPLFSAHPADQLVDLNGTAVFSASFSSADFASVKWFKEAGETDIEITEGVTINNVGSDYDTSLSIANAEAADEGQYYCQANNGIIVDSLAADLGVKRELANYAFDGDLTDSSGNGAPTGTAMDSLGDPNTLLHVAGTVHYVAGADGIGSALYLDPNDYINFGVEGYPKANPVTSNGFGGGLDEGSIVYWIKPTLNAYQIILGNFNDTTAGTGFLSALQADQDNDLLIRHNNVYLANHLAGRPNRPEYDLLDGNWHMIAACWSGNNATLYVDGQWVANATNATPASYDAWQRGMLLGASRQATRHLLSDMFRGGAIDNLRIYNYRLDATGVDVFAQEYYDNTGILPCLNMSFAGNAYNYDNTGSSYCKIDLADFVVFAGEWLSNGLYTPAP